jgi:hypothetical protein
MVEYGAVARNQAANRLLALDVREAVRAFGEQRVCARDEHDTGERVLCGERVTAACDVY